MKAISSLSISDTERFWAKVTILGPLECWLWTAGKNYKGYGAFRLKGVIYLAPRVAWFLTHGQIPEGLLVRHNCDNPPCVNPLHLLLGTHKTNAEDMVQRNRSATGNRSGARKYPERRPRGSASWNAKLNDELVREIRNAIDNEVPRKELGKRYSVSTTTIQRIVTRKSWKHVI